MARCGCPVLVSETRSTSPSGKYPPRQVAVCLRGAVVDLSLTERTVDQHVIVEVHGEADVHTAPELRDRLIGVLDSGHPSVVVDLSWLSFIDSTGLGALVAARNHANAAGASLRLVCKSERLLKVFRITGLHEVFEIHPTLAQATQPA
jgi:anti-sigma B factor antagonist